MNLGVEYILRARDMLSGVLQNAAKQANNVQKSISNANRATGETSKQAQGRIQQLTTRLQYLQERQSRAFDEKYIGRYNVAIRKTREELQRLENLPPKRFVDRIKESNSGANALNGTIMKLVGTVGLLALARSSEKAFNVQAVAESRLTKVMQNMMDARQEDIQSILELASVQQKLGVIGDEVQLSGAQELSTYLTKTESLKKLIPVLNDMLAQQYGLNATQESAVNIATMLGKVMDGQVGALSRYGYKFDDAQEKILKYGNEAQRVAVLADVVSSAVGGMNEALANTPEGRLKQQANNLGDVQEQFGKIVVTVKTAFIPIMERGITFLNNVIIPMAEWVGKNADMVVQLTGVVLGAVTAFHIATNAVRLWDIAAKILNGTMALNPIGAIITAIAALAAGIVYCYNKFDWFRGIINGVWDTMKLFVKFLKDAVMNVINGMVDTFSGLGKIIKSIFTADWDGVVEGAKQAGKGYLNATTGVLQSAYTNGSKIGETFKEGYDRGVEDFNKSKSGEGVNANSFFGSSGTTPEKTTQTVDPTGSLKGLTSGGSRPTNININLNKEMVGQITINPLTMSQGVEEAKDMIMEVLSQVLNSANRLAVE